MSKNDNDSDDEEIFQMDDLRKLDPDVFKEDALPEPPKIFKKSLPGRHQSTIPSSGKSSPPGSLIGYYNEDKIGKMMQPLIINKPTKNYKSNLSSLKKPFRPLTPDNIEELEETNEMRKMKKYYDRVKYMEQRAKLEKKNKSPSYESKIIDKINSIGTE